MPLRPIKIRSLSRAEVRGIDATAARSIGLPTLVLMENAGRGAAELLRNDSTTATACSSSAARQQRRRRRGGRPPPRRLGRAGPGDLVRRPGPAHRGRRRPVRHPRTLGHRPPPPPSELDSHIAQADWVVGRPLRHRPDPRAGGVYRDAVESVNRSGKPALALDIPSGLDADTGEPLGIAVRATLTATFVATKHGFCVEGASDYLGEVHVVEIGVPRCVTQIFEG